jgi:hypothetical protein
MRLTKAEGHILLGAIQAELESQRWRQRRRSGYQTPLDAATELAVQDLDSKRAEDLRSVRDRIKAQL